MLGKNALLSVNIVIQFLFIMWTSQIVCSEAIENNDLMLNIESPGEIIETNVFTVTILANETPVEDVTVILLDKEKAFGSQEYIEYTDHNGEVQFTAPSLIYYPLNKTFSIVAIKVGYITNDKNITIINIPTILNKEEIKTTYKFREIFTLTVIDDSSEPIENATIEFQGAIFHSDNNGKITLNTGRNIGHYELKIMKEGYANYEYDIIIYDQVLQPGPMIGFMFLLGIIISSIVILIIFIAIVLIKKFRGK